MDVKPEKQESFGARVRRLMEERGLSQTAFAERVGMERTELNRTINGKREPRAEEVGRMAHALGVSVELLLQDIKMPDVLHRAAAWAATLVDQMLIAESQRDEALRMAAATEQALADSERARAEDRERQAAELDTVRAETAAQVAAVEGRETALRRRLATVESELAQARSEATRQAARAAALAAEAQALREKASAAGGAALATGVLTGLLGLAIGAALDGGGKGGRRS